VSRPGEPKRPALSAPIRMPNVGGAAAVDHSARVADLDDGELILAVLRPSWWHVPINSAGTLGTIALAILVLIWLSRLPFVPWSDAQAATLGALAMGVRLLWDLTDWSTRRYILTDRRVIRQAIGIAGMPRPSSREIPLRLIQHVGVLSGRRERALSIGTVVISGINGAVEHEDGCDLLWENVKQPSEVQRLIREAMSRYR